MSILDILILLNNKDTNFISPSLLLGAVRVRYLVLGLLVKA